MSKKRGLRAKTECAVLNALDGTSISKAALAKQLGMSPRGLERYLTSLRKDKMVDCKAVGDGTKRRRWRLK